VPLTDDNDTIGAFPVTANVPIAELNASDVEIVATSARVRSNSRHECAAFALVTKDGSTDGRVNLMARRCVTVQTGADNEATIMRTRKGTSSCAIDSGGGVELVEFGFQ
jgi:hypothetical protein